MNKKLFIIGIRYAPVILLLTCSIKIYIRQTICTEVTLVNWINLILNLMLLGLIYIQGVELRFCYLHRSLCRTALWGYIYYGAFLIVSPPKEDIALIVDMYVILTFILVVLYEIIRKHIITYWCH